MAQVRLRTVDAFATEPFTGNPAGVVVLEEAPSEDWMAAVARELNLSETAFVIKEAIPEADFRLRWFTRGAVEVDLCGHATLASAHCLFADGVPSPVRFATRSGVLTVKRREDDSLSMDFPAWPPDRIEVPGGIADALGAPVEWAGRSGNGFVVAVIVDEGTVRGLVPDIARLATLPADVFVVTAPGDEDQPHDYVCRVFAPKIGLDEDPVTGSAQTVLGPYWAERLGRTSLVGLQVSARTGVIGVDVQGRRIDISGHAVTVLDGILR